MRILYVSHSFPIPGHPLSNVGGMQRVAVGLHDALRDHPEVELRRIVLETSWKWTGVRTPFFLGGLLRSLLREARDFQADVVLFSSMVTASTTMLIGRALRAEGIHTAVIPVGRDVTLPNRVYQKLVPRILSSVDTVFPISRATAQTCLERGAKAGQVHVIPCGVDLPPTPSTDQRAEARRWLIQHLSDLGRPVTESNRLLLSVGRHQERKGFHWFVENVLPALPEQYVYLLAGSGPMTNRISEIVEERGLDRRAFLLGRVPEAFLERLYRGSDLFVMPNIPVEGDIEGFGVVMLEAGAAGLPVVAADLEGIRDVITPGENGELVPTGDVGGFVEAILGAEGKDELSERAADHVHSTFGWAAIADQFVGELSRRIEREGNA